MASDTGQKILVVEDDANERSGLQRLLSNAGYEVCAADSADKAMGYMDEAIDFVLTDLQMGDVSGMDLLKHWKLKQPETMFLMITGHGSEATAVEAIKAGAYDYMNKPIDVNKLFVTLQNMIGHRDESRKVRELQNRLDEKFSLSSIIGRSPQMQRVFELIKRSAQAFSTVLILGESGTGKELVAQAIHQNSPRRDGPFLAVNCAAMPATLVESELFGHERGAFTGATDRRMGRFEQASGGTLFIDEIGDFEVSLQVKLLRVMEARTITPIGSNKEIKVDTRVLAATSRDIREMMLKNQFREDLYYRLNVITIELPPLRLRLDDIPLLSRRFMDRVNEQNGTKIAAISPDVIDAMQGYSWPGNVRELLNIIERMMVLTDKQTLEIDDLPAYIRSPVSRPVAGVAGSQPAGAIDNRIAAGASQLAATANGAGVAAPLTLDQAVATLTLAELEERAIAAALVRCNNNRTRAARSLGISVRTLQRKLGSKTGAEGEAAGPGSEQREEGAAPAPAPAAPEPLVGSGERG